MPPPQPEAEQTVPFENKEPQIASFPIVGIGASAGGLEAVTQMLKALPADTGMAFVFVQHLDPAHKSELTTILSKVTLLPVGEAVHGARVEANHLYVIPPNCALDFADRAFQLRPRPSTMGVHLTIDHFFKSLATEQSRLSIGVVLSGTGSDGSEGLKAIKSACGIAFAQDEQSAKYPTMPRSAAATGIVDFVLPPQRIAEELARISRNPYVISPASGNAQELLPEGDGELKEIFSLLMRGTGVDFTHYKQPTMRRRIGRRMVVHRFSAMGEYVAYLRRHPEEVKELYRDALINVTSFFRDPNAFAALSTHISGLLRNKQVEQSFRIWVPGCSTGEEVYSLAICVQELSEHAGIRPELQIFGTDISERALETARAGVYPERILEEVSPERLSRHFTRVDGKYQIHKTIRDSCIFAKHDLTRDTPFSHLDLISCRNVLIYLGAILQKGLLPTFHYALNPTGLLFLGTAESVGSNADLFAVVDSKHKIFSRKAATPAISRSFTWHPKTSDNYTQVQVATAVGNQNLGNRVDRVIRDRYAPDAVVINRSWQILQFRGQTGFYLEPAPGDASYHLLRMARGNLPFILRDVVSRAVEENTFVERTNVRVEHGGEVRDVSLEVIPLEGEPNSDSSYLVVFRRHARQTVEQPFSTQPLPLAEVDQRIVHLEQELADLRRYHRATAEEHDAAMEELRALNEELGSANEELQSSNEELGTTKEELQSSNEELTTINEELDTRNQQLGNLNDDLNNLFSAVTSPILKVDRDLRLQRITPASEMLGIDPRDLTHPARDLQQRLGNLPDIEPLIRGVIDKLIVQTYDFRDGDGHWWSLSIRPYRTADHRIDGAVLTFADTNSVQHALEISEVAREYSDAILQTVREPLVILTPDLNVERANAAFYQAFPPITAKIEGQSLSNFRNGRWDFPQLQSKLEQVLRTTNSFADFQVEHIHPDLGVQVLLLNARLIRQVGKKSPAILLAFEDITDRLRAERQTAEKLTKAGQELDRTKEDLRALAVDLMNAQDREARRIARELHDNFSQRLAILEMTIRHFLERDGKDPETVKMLEALLRHISHLFDDVRNLSHRMHPSSLEHLGLERALKDLVAESESLRPGLVHFQGENISIKLPVAFTSGIYRIAQEALQNARKYAPEATVTLTLTQDESALHLSISDAGPGFDSAEIRGRGGLGIISMQERARGLNGDLQIQSSLGQGVTVTLDVPLPDAQR